MSKTILITGATDGIGFVTAQLLLAQGHQVLIHGRNPEKLAKVEQQLGGNVSSYVADLSNLSQVAALADTIAANHSHLDVLINNAGVFSTAAPRSSDGLDVRFAVNTIAPYLLTKKLLPLLSTDSRVVNLASAAQAPVDIDALTRAKAMSDNAAYAQSKLALISWTWWLAQQANMPLLVSVNPKSLLGSKMVQDAYGIAGGDLSIGADVLTRAALSDEFAHAHGKYFDNDIGQFAAPQPQGNDPLHATAIVEAMDQLLSRIEPRSA
ncbi:SDR family NAD(P)-dependent oxidoreductase [uncultured Ferrimonas sp.]|uniref:SDR family NAD(P)-dependent oxidoreductase n=1 Tax=uncultured Ferrimonas sp. TaxID=432640 RepID=UPI0026380A42|nr:SDR family NAD(P)-dependent oxidoreductase [uncultured Ferrimonas sp.]